MHNMLQFYRRRAVLETIAETGTAPESMIQLAYGRKQMTREQVFFFLQCKAVLETVGETGEVPESMVYLALRSDIDLTNSMLGFLKQLQAIKVKNHLITKGEDFDKIMANLVAFAEKVGGAK